MGASPEVWIPGFHGNRDREAVRLLCFPFAGGAASAFNPWRAACDAGLDICPIQYPGRETRWRDPAFENLDALVSAIAADLDPLWNRPFAFWGHSFGGLVAYELAARLLQAGHRGPAHLFISGAHPPNLPVKERIQQLSDPEFLVAVKKYGGITDDIPGDAELLSLLLPVIKHDFRLFEEYKFSSRGPLPVPISVFGGVHDACVPVGDILGWSSCTSSTFRTRFLDGGHFFLFEAVAEIMNFIVEDLRTSRAISSGVSAGATQKGAAK